MSAPTLNTTTVTTPSHHESARAQVQGRADYIDDLPRLEGLLHAAPILSPVANGRLLGLDAQDALQAPGIAGIVTAQDIPGDRLLATFVHDEAIFGGPELAHVGQVLGLVVGSTHRSARMAAQKNIRLHCEAGTPLMHAREALQAGSFVLPKVQVLRGDAARALQTAPHRLSGSLEIGGQAPSIT